MGILAGIGFAVAEVPAVAKIGKTDPVILYYQRPDTVGETGVRYLQWGGISVIFDVGRNLSPRLMIIMKAEKGVGSVCQDVFCNNYRVHQRRQYRTHRSIIPATENRI